MKQILLFGAGKSATALIHYLLESARKENWRLVVVDADLTTAQKKVGNSPFGDAVSFDISKNEERVHYIQEADIVISLLPPALHFLIAQDCLHFKKNLLTASYADADINSLKNEIEDSGLLFLCEMGLDPGIDHMSAKKWLTRFMKMGEGSLLFIHIAED
jgi:saccharopine dehydrogenase-like NADP-dependent oxidoreductase